MNKPFNKKEEKGEGELEEAVDMWDRKEEPLGLEIMNGGGMMRIEDTSNKNNLSKMTPGQKLDTAANELADAEQPQPMSIEK